MNYLFTREYQFVVNASIQSIRNDFNNMTKKFENNSETIKGKLNDDDTFIFIDKWIWGLFLGSLSPNWAYLKGSISEQENKTIIAASVKPNFVLVISFYIIPVMLVNQIIYMINRNEPIFQIVLIVLFFPLFSFIIYKFIQVMTNHLINRFKFFMMIE